MMRKTISSVLAVAACAAAYAGGLKFDITSDHEDATYKLGEQAVFTVKVLDASGAPAKSGRVKWNLNNFGAKVFASGTEDLAANGGTFTVKGAQTEPGFLRLDVTEVGKKPSSAKWGVAFEPKKIVPGTPYPDDFMDFWRSAIAKYDCEVTEPIRVTEVKRTAASVMYELRIPSTQGRYVWGYFSEPVDKTKGPFPLHVSVPGAGPSSWGCPMGGNAMFLKVNGDEKIDPYYRTTKIVYAHFKDDGAIVTDDFIKIAGVGQYDAGWDVIKGEWYFAASDGIYKKENEDGFEIRGIGNGSYLYYQNVNSMRQNAPVELRLSNGNKEACTVEIRENSPFGAVLGSFRAGYTGGFDKFETFRLELDNAYGTHNLCFVFYSEAEEAARFEDFRFTKIRP